MGHTHSLYFEAGSLVMGDGGVLIMDEFDGITDEENALLNEAMTKGCVTVNKNGIYVSFPTRCDVLATMTIEGHEYSESEYLSRSRIHLNSAYTLIYLVKNEPSEYRHDFLKRLLISLTAPESYNFSFYATNTIEETCTYENSTPHHSTLDSSPSDVSHATTTSPATNRLLKRSFMKRFINYARIRSTKPSTFTNEAIIKLTKYFLSVRNRSISCTPTTPSLIESIIKIAIANARLNLSYKNVTEDDVEVALSLLPSFLSSTNHIVRCFLDNNTFFLKKEN